MAEPVCIFPSETTKLDRLALASWARVSPHERARSPTAPEHALERLRASLAWPATLAGQVKASGGLQALGCRRVQRRVIGRREWRYSPPGEPEVQP